ncbi:MAG: type II secretion system F family protein [Bacteroidota bacterium]
MSTVAVWGTTSQARSSSSSSSLLTRFQGRVSDAVRVQFTRSLAAMVAARLALPEALRTARATTSSRALQGIIDQVLADVQRGRSLSDALESHPKVFDAMYVDLVRVGEAAGALDEVLMRLAEHSEKTSAMRRRVRAALTYPAVIVVIATGAVGFFLASIVPTFADMFAQFDAELPGPTQLVIGLSELLTSRLLPTMMVVLVTVLGVRSGLKTARGQRLWSAFRRRIPVVGSLLTKATLARFCHTMATLLSSGVSLLDALRLLGRSSRDRALADDLRRVAEQVARGGALHRTMAQSRLFPPMVVQMMAVGEETASLDRMMEHVGRHYEHEVDTALEGLTSLIEPALIVVIGLVIGSILMALYLPMFDLMNVIG